MTTRQSPGRAALWQVLQAGGLQLRTVDFRMVGVGVRVGTVSAPENLPGHMALQASKWVSAALPEGCLPPSLSSPFLPSGLCLRDLKQPESLVPDTPSDLYPWNTAGLIPQLQALRSVCCRRRARVPWVSGRRWPWSAWGEL